MCNKIRRLIRKRKRSYKIALSSNSPSDWLKFRRLRNKSVNACRIAKKKYLSKLTASLRDKSNLYRNSWWNTIKSLIGISRKSNSIPALLCNGIQYVSAVDKAMLFNDYFTAQSTVNDTHSQIPPNQIPDNKLSNIIITETDVRDVLLSLDTSKATGPDLLNPRLLKEGANELASPLCILFNSSLQLGIFPNSWKIANVIPVHKKNEKNDVKNYRPISLLSIVGKVMERCVFKYVHNFLNDYNLITDCQSGFRPGDSTINQLLNITNDLGRAIDSGREVRIVFCDISKAFDRVWHKGLIHKLINIGLDGKVIEWFKNYLTDRKQKVIINGVESYLSDITAGVPQGSILGPLLFVIFINDIVTDIGSIVKLFADDTSVYVIVDSPLLAAERLNSDMEKIYLWSKACLVDFNPQKGMYDCFRKII